MTSKPIEAIVVNHFVKPCFNSLEFDNQFEKDT